MGNANYSISLKYVFDNMIHNGDIRLVIIVTPTFYNGGANSISDVHTLTHAFQNELREYLISAVEITVGTTIIYIIDFLIFSLTLKNKKDIMKTLFFISLFSSLCFISCAQNDKKGSNHQQNILENMKLKITVGEVELTATMYDNPTTQDLISMLPITTELEDYASMEKIFYPERKLSKEGAPSGYKPSVGDITYYAPWGDIAIFYKDFGHASGLISLGKIENNGIEQLRKAGNTPVTFELISE
ncbi:cyclophilin-like fold protein [Chondrinema litorale]|uniref:cyclophilin-like fold protein n=1 Tax=Chondrinema litorale TaxID=2994555 RepID=UPI002542B6D2|nr:cyclophilin-like fold protein [Chondrinema litorale]UZR96818.1 cyclophilin-like fold protein [Chondrinema litorale]